MQANDVFVICISSKCSIQNHAYLFLFLKLKRKLMSCQNCFIKDKIRTFDNILFYFVKSVSNFLHREYCFGRVVFFKETNSSQFLIVLL